MIRPWSVDPRGAGRSPGRRRQRRRLRLRRRSSRGMLRSSSCIRPSASSRSRRRLSRRLRAEQRQAGRDVGTVPGPFPTLAAVAARSSDSARRDGLAAIDCYASAEAATAPGRRCTARTTVAAIASPSSTGSSTRSTRTAPRCPAEPAVRPGARGDWELVTVILDRAGRPLTAGYSRHCSGARRAWAKVPKRGQRPVVYVALGSHANYFAPGTWRTTSAAGRSWPSGPRELREDTCATSRVVARRCRHVSRAWRRRRPRGWLPGRVGGGSIHLHCRRT